ncbi:hypothetical protein AKJ09_02648 [Labilithrix luteola]|uniref:PEGA domain-containing protein n=1 Tax=Labilithrix luteola TaxID=1391654 RepID=A0A0K1PS75_9BACT|nr:hypothetical protein [Labilithrix luteola]AKU95984.1 hypothetical protein AKJ09_02648 [Labilithrix luteola]
MRWAIFVFAATLLVPSIAWAQADGAARAQVLFDEAVAESRAGKYATACPKFAASQRLDPKTSTLLNLASCYELNGQTASAWAAFKEAEAFATKRGRADWAERAANAVKELEPKLVRITVHVPSAVAIPQLHVELDGSELQSAEWNHALPVDPGEHRVAWSAPGFASKTDNVKVAASSVELTLTVLDPVPNIVSSSPSSPASSPLPTPAPFWTTGRVVGAVLAGTGAVSLVAGSAFGLSAKSKYDEAEGLCGVYSGSPRTCLPNTSAEAVAAREDASSRATVSTVFFVAGGALIAGGAVLFAISSPSSSRRVAIVPTGTGLVAAGRW